MLHKKKSLSVFFEISSSQNLASNGQSFANLFRNVVETFILPFNYPLTALVENTNGRTTLYNVNEGNLKSSYQLLQNGKIRHIVITQDVEAAGEDNYITPAIAVSATCDYYNEQKYILDIPICDSMAISLSERAITHPIPAEWQAKIVDLFKKVSCEIMGINGFLTISYQTASISPHTTHREASLNLFYETLSHKFEQICRGGFWGNILTEGHIERLGGIELVKQQAPCYLVEELTCGSYKAVYLQLTEDINSVTEAQVNALEEYFTPILPTEETYDEILAIHQSKKRG